MVGTGRIGAVHARSVRAAGARLRGVLASTPEHSERVAAEWDAPVGYPDLDAVLADDAVQVVHICTPNALHLPFTEAALRAGKDVICEKPLATSTADAERATRTAQEAGRLLAVPFVYRYHPLVREICERRLGGQFGKWQALHGSYLQDWLLPPDATSWRLDPELGGPSRAFADIGAHWCDLVEWVAGVRFAEVCARLATTIRGRSDTEDVAVLLLRTHDGVLGTLTVSQVSAGRKNRLWFELDGAFASAVFDQERPETIWLGGRHGSRVLVRDPDFGSAEQRRLATLPAGHPQGYHDCFTAFVADAYAAMDGDQAAGLPTGADGARAARLVDAVLRSNDTLAWATVEEAT